MSGEIDPALVSGRPLLHWLDEVFVAWPWRLEPDCLADRIPPRVMSPSGLRRWLLANTTDYPTRDRTWAQIVLRARPATDPARSFRLLAVGLAGYGLRNYRRRIHVRTVDDLPDLHADLVTGFLTRLAVIDPHGPNLAGRLIDSAIRHAARRYRDQQALPHPVPTELLMPTIGYAVHDDADPDGDGLLSEQIIDPAVVAEGRDVSSDSGRNVPNAGAGDPDGDGLGRVLRRVAALASLVGPPVSTQDLELIAATRLHRQPLPEVAAALGIGVQAAYKRRQRAEQRLAAVLRPAPRPR